MAGEAVTSDMQDLTKQEDFFHMEGVEKGKRGRWVENKARRIQYCKRLGYEVVPSFSLDESTKNLNIQKEWARVRMNDEKTTPLDRKTAASILEHLNTAPLDTTTNIPEHIAMQIDEENYQKRVAIKAKRASYLKDQIELQMDKLNKKLQQGGLGGGIKGMKDIIEKMVKDEMSGKKR